MQKFKYSERFFEISFSDKISKQAYLKACKWLAVNVWGKEGLSEYVSVKILKNSTYKLPTFDVELYITMDGTGMKDEYCHKCKTLHTVMYSMDKPNCHTCKLQSCINNMHDGTEGIVKFWKGVFEDAEKI